MAILGLACCCAARAHEKAYCGLARCHGYLETPSNFAATILLISKLMVLTCNQSITKGISDHPSSYPGPVCHIHHLMAWYLGCVYWKVKLMADRQLQLFIKLVVFGSLSKMDAHEQRLLFLIHFIENPGCTTSNDVTGRLEAAQTATNFKKAWASALKYRLQCNVGRATGTHT